MGLIPLSLALGRGRAAWKLRGAGLLAGLAGVVVCLSPILGQWERFTGWFWRLTKNDSAYGASTGHVFINPDKYLSNLMSMVSEERITVIVTLLGAAALVIAILRKGERSDMARRGMMALAGVIAAEVVQFLLVAKHPGVRYLVPGVAASGLTICLAAMVLRSCWSRFPALCVSTAGLVIVGTFAVRALSERLSRLKPDTETRVSVWAAASAEMDRGGLVVLTYGTSSPIYALAFANPWTGNRYDAEVNSVMRNCVVYDPWANIYKRTSARVELRELAEAAGNGKLFMSCPAWMKPPGFRYTPITTDGAVEVLYRAEIDGSAQP
jgi:hypothetical protein